MLSALYWVGGRVDVVRFIGWEAELRWSAFYWVGGRVDVVRFLLGGRQC